jgi:amylosucrase
MVMLWSTMASRDVRLAEQALSRRRPAPQSTSWVTYARCHDDIGWAVSDEDAAAVGLNGFSHRRFLSDYYSGRFPGSFARGALFQVNEATGDARISGSAASLCGIESALATGDEHELMLALRRLESIYAVVFSFGGIPLIYMGDELAMLNDPHWDDDLAHADDNRWMHRPTMDWAAANRRGDPTTLEGRAFDAIRRLVDARRSLLALRAGGETEIVPTGLASVLAYRRVHPRSVPFLALTNFSDATQEVNLDVVRRAGLNAPRHVHSTTGELNLGSGQLRLPPWGFGWLTST